MARFYFWLALAFVLIVYTFFASIGTMEFHRVRWDQGFGKPAEGYYASLAEGFLRGQLSMAHKPDPRLMALPNPYDFDARHDKVPYLWDASYLNGKYYLYFTPLPALLFYIPFRLAGGMYPHDQLAGLVFTAWAFVMSVLFVRRALANRTLLVPLPVWIVALGLASVIPFLIVHSRTYEIAILCGAAMTSTWAYALLRYLESPSTSRLVWTTIWLALAIAARPNLGVLLLVYLFLRPRLRQTIVALIPLAVTAALLLTYNYARYRDPLEFGHRYQLTYMSMADRHVCGIRSMPELVRFVKSTWIYVHHPPVFTRDFPFVDFNAAAVDPATSFSDVSDQVVGLAALAPLAMLGSGLALVGFLGTSVPRFLGFLGVPRGSSERADEPRYRGTEEPRYRERAAKLVLAAGWLALFGLATCWHVSARYEADFWFLISAGAIVILEAAWPRVRWMRAIFTVTALVGSLIGAMAAFRGSYGAFPYFNRELFDQLSRIFS